MALCFVLGRGGLAESSDWLRLSTFILIAACRAAFFLRVHFQVRSVPSYWLDTLSATGHYGRQHWLL